MAANPRLKNRKQVTITVNPETWEKFRELSKETRITLAKLADEAIEDILKKYQK